MKSEPVSGIQPAVIRWARQTIGLSLHDVAVRLKCPVEEIEAWESGAGVPTYAQLEKLAYQVYKRPLAVFFLPTPPEEATPEREFRTLPDTDLYNLAADTHLQIRRGHAYQLALRELYAGHNPGKHLIWRDLRLSREVSLASQARTVRDYLGISLEVQTLWNDDEHALKQWRQAIEDVGIFVFKAPFKQKEISGFCLLDPDFPIIYVNNSSTKTRQIFSLLHELAHLLFRINGISKQDSRYVDYLPKTERQVEQFCNAFAAELLIPQDDFRAQTQAVPANAELITEEQFSLLARRYGVSREAILRRFLEQQRVGSAYYEQKAKAWAAQRRTRRGGNWYASQNTYLSDRFAREVISRYYRHQFSVEQASDMLGINAKNFAGLEQAILRGGAP